VTTSSSTEGCCLPTGAAPLKVAQRPHVEALRVNPAGDCRGGDRHCGRHGCGRGTQWHQPEGAEAGVAGQALDEAARRRAGPAVGGLFEGEGLVAAGG
jgi:hypothetical protein